MKNNTLLNDICAKPSMTSFLLSAKAEQIQNQKDLEIELASINELRQKLQDEPLRYHNPQGLTRELNTIEQRINKIKSDIAVRIAEINFALKH